MEKKIKIILEKATIGSVTIQNLTADKKHSYSVGFYCPYANGEKLSKLMNSLGNGDRIAITKAIADNYRKHQ